MYMCMYSQGVCEVGKHVGGGPGVNQILIHSQLRGIAPYCCMRVSKLDHEYDMYSSDTI